jgi:hypothetical protein
MAPLQLGADVPLDFRNCPVVPEAVTSKLSVSVHNTPPAVTVRALLLPPALRKSWPSPQLTVRLAVGLAVKVTR